MSVRQDHLSGRLSVSFEAITEHYRHINIFIRKHWTIDDYRFWLGTICNLVFVSLGIALLSNGTRITRIVLQGEFQHLEKEASSNLRRKNQASSVALGSGLIYIGQLSLHFPQGFKADCGTASSQTPESSELESDIDSSLIQPALRTRNGTLPLLFGGSSRS